MKYNISVLILGDSHPNQGIDRSYFPEAFVFAIEGGKYAEIYYILRAELENNEQISFLALQIDPHSIDGKKPQPNFYPVRYWKNYLSWQELKVETQKSIPRLYLEYLFAFLGNARDVINLLSNYALIEPNRYSKFSEDPLRESTAQKRVESSITNDAIEKKDILPLLQMVEFAKQKKLAVVLIKYPLSPEYLMALNKKQFNSSKYYQFINKSLQEYGDVYTYDFQRSYNSSYFSDSDHLNYEGAELFSNSLRKAFLEQEIS
ncbi:MAG: hypothetical protein AABX33_04620 [Nanoarchaeota archaeon]